MKVCGYLEKLEAGWVCPYCGKVFNKFGVFAPPRHSKTEQVSRRFPAWYMGRHPQHQLICAQNTGQNAADTGANVREIVKSPEFRRVFGSFELREDAQAAGRWVSSKGGIYYAAGVGGTITGRGAHLLDIDDPISGREDADSPRMRMLAKNWYYGNAITRLMPNAIQLLTHTRWHQEDLAGVVIPDKETWTPTDDFQFFCAGDWHVLRLRAIENENTPHEEALWPAWYSLDYLQRLRETLNKAGRGREWEAQYQQNPVPEEGALLKRIWFEKRYDFPPKDCVIYLSTDFAVTSSQSAKDPDRTEIAVLGLGVDDCVYVLDWVTETSAPDVWITRLIDLIEENGPAAVLGEKGAIRNAVWPALEREMQKRRVGAYFEWVPTVGEKLSRGTPLRAWASSGRHPFSAERALGQQVHRRTRFRRRRRAL